MFQEKCCCEFKEHWFGCKISKNFFRLETAVFFVVLGVIVPGTYCYASWGVVSLSSLTEPLGFACKHWLFFKNQFTSKKFVNFRFFRSYSLPLVVMLFAFLSQPQQVCDACRSNDCWSVLSNFWLKRFYGLFSKRSDVKTHESHFEVSKKFCKVEAMAMVAFAMIYVVSVPMMFTVGVLLTPNESKLPFHYEIVGLPDGYPISTWILNYILQFAIAVSTSSLYVIIQSLTMVHLNHSCYLIDSTLVYVQELDDVLNRSNDPPSHPLQWLSIRRKLRKVRDMVESVVDWQNHSNESLQLVFFIILTMHFSVLCGLIVSVSKNPAESFAAIILTFLILSDLFASCWMGSRVVQKFKKLTNELQGINWDSMVPNQRKDLVFILLLSQNTKSNHGVFMPVDMTTFQAVRTKFPFLFSLHFEFSSTDHRVQFFCHCTIAN